MSGIVKVIESFFFRKGEEVARHRTIEAGFRWTRKLIKEYLSQKTSYEVFRTKGALQAHQYGIGGFSLKLFRLAKSPVGKCESFAILTDGQW